MITTGLILVDSEATLPYNAYPILKDYDTLIRNHLELNPTVDTLDLRSIADDYKSKKHFKPVLSELQNIIAPYDFEVYHCSRVINPQAIYETGLYVLDMERYCKTMLPLIYDFGVSPEQEKDIVSIFKDYIETDLHGRRGGQVSFFTPRSMAKEYSQYSECVGGEVVQFGFEKYPELMCYLSKIGTPVIVHYRLPFTKIAEARQELVVIEILRHLVGKQYCGLQYNIKFDGATLEDVPKERILKVEECYCVWMPEDDD